MIFSVIFLPVLASKSTEKNIENFPESPKYDAKHWPLIEVVCKLCTCGTFWYLQLEILVFSSNWLVGWFVWDWELFIIWWGGRGHPKKAIWVNFKYKKTSQQGPNVSITPITAMGCRQCLSLSVVQLKGKHCCNGAVDTLGQGIPLGGLKS